MSQRNDIMMEIPQGLFFNNCISEHYIIKFVCFSAAESSSDFSDDEKSSENAAALNNNIPFTSSASTLSVDRSSTCVSPAASSSSVKGPNSQYLLENILRKIEHLANMQDQQTLMLNNILSSIQSTSVTLTKPGDIPNLPINSKPEYKALEEFLRNEEKFNYMVYYLFS